MGYLIDSVLCELIEKGIDVKGCLESNLVAYHITHDSYPTLHHNPTRIIIPSNLALVDIISDYRKSIGNHKSL